MRIGIPGQFGAMKTAGLMQGMNQAGARAMQYDMDEKKLKQQADQHAAEMALQQMEVSQRGRLADDRLGLDSKVADRTFDTDGRRINLDQQRIGLEGRNLDDTMTRSREGIASQEGMARASRDFEGGQRKLDRRHDLKKISAQQMSERDLLREKAELEQDAEGPHGWRRVANRGDEDRRYGRDRADQVADMKSVAERALELEGKRQEGAEKIQGMQSEDSRLGREAMVGNTMIEVGGRQIVAPTEAEVMKYIADAGGTTSGLTPDMASARIIIERLKSLRDAAPR